VKLKLNTESISRIANAYIIIFLKSLKDTLKELEDYTFLNALLGFVYAAKKLLNAMQALNMLSSDQVIKINEQLELAATQDVPGDKIIEVLKDYLSKEDQDG